MSSNKFRRAYSLRIPRSPKPAAFLDSTAFYDRLDETEVQDDFHSQNEALGKNDKFSWEIPLITEAPKLHYCRKKWSSKSLRLPKSRQAEAEPPAPQPEEAIQMDDDTYDSHQEPERPSSSEGRRLSNDSESHNEAQNEGQKQKSKKMKQYKKGLDEEEEDDYVAIGGEAYKPECHVYMGQTIDRAFRRGWDTFISNLYTMSLARSSQDAPHLIKAC